MSVSQNRAPIELALARTDSRACELREVYEQNHRWVYSTALRILGNAADAEDLTCEVFVLVHRRLHTFPEDASFTTWLHRLTVRAILMYLRKQQYRLEESEDPLPLSDDAYLLSIPASLPETVALETAIAQLPPEDRMAFVLHEIEGYDHHEIARMLGVSNQTCQSQIHNARLSVRQLLIGFPAQAVSAGSGL